MIWTVLQTRRFGRQYKKLHGNIVSEVDTAIGRVAEAPAKGTRKKGDLAELYVHKFYANNQLYLLGYTFDIAVKLIYLEAVGTHENFYRDIKR